VSLLLANLQYVIYRLVVSGPLVKLLTRRIHWWWAVLIMAQCSFAVDSIIFYFYYQPTQSTELLNIVTSDLLYTVRVVVAWYFIKLLIDRYKINYWASLLIITEVTFMFDYFIFDILW
jgi:hypothetical protein